ncbi:MAG TPA: hypothetical protein VGM31_09015 [Puia sp.]
MRTISQGMLTTTTPLGMDTSATVSTINTIVLLSKGTTDLTSIAVDSTKAGLSAITVGPKAVAVGSKTATVGPKAATAGLNVEAPGTCAVAMTMAAGTKKTIGH